MTGPASPRRGGIVVGIALVLLGGAALLAQATGMSIGWPAWIIVPGVALILGAVAVGGAGGSGMAAIGGILTMVGVVLAVQEANDLYRTWAYAWALVAPGGVGLGLAIYGLLTGRREDLRGGLGAMFVGIVLFLVGFLFFEGVLDLSDGHFGDLAEVAVPLLIVGAGVVVLVGAFVPGPWRASKTALNGGGAAAGASSGWAAAGGAATGAGSTAPNAGGAAAGGPSAGAGAPAGVGSAAADPAGVAQRLAVPLEGAMDAEVMVTFGAGHLRTGVAGPGLLVDGEYTGGVNVERGGGPGRIRLSAPTRPTSWTWDRAPYAWTMGLTAEVPLRLRVETGASDADLDLSALQVVELRLRTGASEARVTLPAAAGHTRVDAEGGAASIRFRVPDGVAARIRSTMALASSDVDTARFPRNAAGSAWESPDFEGAANRVEIEVRGGVGSVSVR
jgi:hypothetical protein